MILSVNDEKGLIMSDEDGDGGGFGFIGFIGILLIINFLSWAFDWPFWVY